MRVQKVELPVIQPACFVAGTPVLMAADESEVLESAAEEVNPN